MECTVLFADIVDSSALYGRYDDNHARAIIARCLTLMSDICRSYAGVVVKTIGDEVLCRFAAPDHAVRAACGIHETLECHESLDGDMFAAHIGVHYGSAFVDHNDLHGDGVNIAAHMTTIAKPRQTITTQGTVDVLSAEVAALTRLYDVISLKGNRREMSIYEVLWQQEEATSILTRTDLRAQSAIAHLKLSYNANDLMITQATPAMLIGRGSDCDLIVDADLVSRVHARIEHRRGKFVLIDESTNGTFVKPEAGQEVYLRREEMPLTGRGHISLARASGSNEDLIYYSAH